MSFIFFKAITLYSCVLFKFCFTREGAQDKYVCMYVCTRIRIYESMYVSLYVCMYIACVCVCVCVCVYVCVCMKKGAPESGNLQAQRRFCTKWRAVPLSLRVAQGPPLFVDTPPNTLTHTHARTHAHTHTHTHTHTPGPSFIRRYSA